MKIIIEGQCSHCYHKRVKDVAAVYRGKNKSLNIIYLLIASDRLSKTMKAYKKFR